MRGANGLLSHGRAGRLIIVASILLLVESLSPFLLVLHDLLRGLTDVAFSVSDSVLLSLLNLELLLQEGSNLRVLHELL